MRKLATALATAAALLVIAAPTANAYEPVGIVHTEKVQAGPYPIVVGFSTWPVRAQQSLDFTFAVDGGVQGKSGVLTVTAPDDTWREPLARHPRKRDVWGLDVRAMQQPGKYTFQFRVDGPQGVGEGRLADLAVLEQPGPPMGLSWGISTVPLLGLVVFLAVAWRRTRKAVLAG
ncbi:hypothetical protein [Actinokineospora diospyrosa]|uniref:Methionine-rich copper-binding protein CopC n=1 Tax=Actinokineospora diospyrosa TaxID=103728 RepID=A0ABT1IF49_9PSEU|nr:hypothetical protein [Actinokineospora diospyrosa]MCP2271272.1 hypothetical protein [Actinokineospora diospyrosa]